MQLDKDTIKKLTRGERAGTVATIFCGIVLVVFGAALIYFAVAGVETGSPLRIATFVCAPVLIAAGAGVAAFCNLKYGAATDKLVKAYIQDVLIENAALMHPEKNSLTFYLNLEGTSATLKVNNYSEKIVFDFSAFDKLSTMRKAGIAGEVEKRITVTFLKLALERGFKFTSVDLITSTGSKKSKPAAIIKDGQPDKRALKIYRREG